MRIKICKKYLAIITIVVLLLGMMPAKEVEAATFSRMLIKNF
ncbi:MAG: hypothetical protein AB1643_00375 [Patescibacteria group bacterium]